LLDKATDNVVVYPEEAVTDGDGNTRTQPSKTGVPARARIGQVITTIDTDVHGDRTSERTDMVLIGWTGGELGAQSEVELRGKRWVIDGDPDRYTRSRRTTRTTYAINRY
jgi:hypothetical protein